MQQVKTLLMLADIVLGMKLNTPKTLQLYKYWSTSAQFLPMKGHVHYELLKNFVQEQQLMKTMT